MQSQRSETKISHLQFILIFFSIDSAKIDAERKAGGRVEFSLEAQLGGFNGGSFKIGLSKTETGWAITGIYVTH